MNAPKVTVAEYIARQLALCGKSQRDVAIEAGYTTTNKNMITMFKLGSARVPINKVGVLAKALGVDPAFFLQLVMREYQPEVWDVITDIMGRKVDVSERDTTALQIIQESLGDANVDFTDDQNAMELRETLSRIADRSNKREIALTSAYEVAAGTGKRTK